MVEQSNGYWKELVAGLAVDMNEINYNQTSQPKITKSYIKSDDATKNLRLPKKEK